MKSSFWPVGLSAFPAAGLVAGLAAGLSELPVDGLVEGFEAEGLETAPVDGFVEVPVEGFAAAGLSTVVLGLTLVFIDGFSADFLIGFEGLATVDFLLLSFDDGLVCEPDVVLLG